MLILECVEQKECSGLLPISSLRSRHCSGVATGGIVVCTTGAFCAQDQGPVRARGGVPERRSCRDKDGPPCVAIENLVSLQSAHHVTECPARDRSVLL